jgi:hypothetical protein
MEYLLYLSLEVKTLLYNWKHKSTFGFSSSFQNFQALNFVILIF